MNKKFLLIIFSILLIGSGIAYTIGNTITQEQFDRQDFLSANLNMNIVDTYKTENDRLIIVFNYDTLRPELDENGLETGLWEVVQLTGRIPYYLPDYRACRDTNTIDECKAVAFKEVKQKAKVFRDKEREWLEEQKTIEINNELGTNDFVGRNIND